MSVKQIPRHIPPKAKLRSLSELDGRTVLARQARDLKRAITSDLGDDLSAAQTVLVTRAALLDAFCGACEARWLASGGEGELDPSYPGAVGALRHVLNAIGVERKPRNITPTVDQYIESINTTKDSTQ